MTQSPPHSVLAALIAASALLATCLSACGGPGYPEDREPTAIWLPYGLKGEAGPPELDEPDHDGDGVYNDVDRCPDLAEDVDGFRDDDGCPDVDHDGDGVPDDKDLAP